jgi:uncharacterized membrane protein YsdA (DUF1294 family)
MVRRHKINKGNYQFVFLAIIIVILLIMLLMMME